MDKPTKRIQDALKILDTYLESFLEPYDAYIEMTYGLEELTEAVQEIMQKKDLPEQLKEMVNVLWTDVVAYQTVSAQMISILRAYLSIGQKLGGYSDIINQLQSSIDQ